MTDAQILEEVNLINMNIRMRYKLDLVNLVKAVTPVVPDVVEKATEVFGNILDVAFFLSGNHAALNTTPYNALRHGRKQEVLDILGRIQHGIVG